jgi:hypothetical protein
LDSNAVILTSFGGAGGELRPLEWILSGGIRVAQSIKHALARMAGFGLSLAAFAQTPAPVPSSSPEALQPLVPPEVMGPPAPEAVVPEGANRAPALAPEPNRAPALAPEPHRGPATARSGSASSPAKSVAPARICYLSLNVPDEYQEMTKLSQKLNPVSPQPIEVHEYQPNGMDPTVSFKKMVESGQKCDGLVLSGHHTGAFGGSRTPHAKLPLEFLENLSCDARYADWFLNVKALWLQGCRTLASGADERVEPTAPQTAHAVTETADAHTFRVGGVLHEDHLSQSFRDLNIEYTATLDQDNPLSSRYMRVFPGATVFGWTKSAPSASEHSEYSIPYHLAQFIHLADDDHPWIDPRGELTADQALKVSVGLLTLLNRSPLPSAPQHGGCDYVERLAAEAWINHGHAERYRLAFTNPAINAFASLLGGNDATIKEAREIDCLLKKNPEDEIALRTVDRILADPALIGYNFNTMWELLLRAKRVNNRALYDAVRDRMRASANLTHFLHSKFENKKVGVVRKIDFYSFYKDVYGGKLPELETSLRGIIVKMVTDGLGKGELSQDEQQFHRSLLDSLAKADLLTAADTQQLIDHPKGRAYLLGGLGLSLSMVPSALPERGALFEKIVASPRNDGASLTELALVLSYAYDVDKDKIFDLAIRNPGATDASLARTANLLKRKPSGFRDIPALLKAIADSPAAGPLVKKELAAL